MNLIPTRADSPKPAETVPPLRHGDRLTRAEFERRYDAMPELKKAELIDGVVYMSSPVTNDHSSAHATLGGWLGLYRIDTLGVVGGTNGSLRLDLKNMPQPDVFLRIEEPYGGQSRIDAEHYVEGGPELVAEVAVSSADFDLKVKLPLYARHKVREYLVWRVADKEIDWFVLRGSKYGRLRPGADGLYRSKVFPGLWLAAQTLLGGDLKAMAAAVQHGVGSPEHAAFVQKLQRKAARKRP
ncbi:MAG TPA: Uma2 family endonuclease [Gemmataceae bacterium]|nr:Uma2 family endonuclease [Gemmataceae bacterium]